MNLRVLTSATLLFVAVFASRSAAYSLYGSKWTTSTVTMQLQLGANSGVLSDGFSSWGASAEDALYIWNSHIGATKFAVVRDSTAPRTGPVRNNNVYFSADVNGQAWGTGVLAVTLIYSSGSSQVETDVLFNNRVAWNSYRGPQRSTNTGAPLYDFRRVALHEFGHALGLDHPDEEGQSVSALMNSRVSALDALTADDIGGAQALYGGGAIVVVPPTITVHPTSRSVVPGQGTTFTVAASSATSLSYRWTKSGVTLPSATSSTFSIASVTLADAGSYAAVVSNAGGSVTSTAATLTVTSTTPTAPPPAAPTPPPPVATTPVFLPPPTAPTVTPPTILVAPAGQSANVGGTVGLYVVANGSAPFFYQWRKEGAVIPGATSSSLSLSNVQAVNGGSYSVTVSNAAGAVTSPPAVVMVHSLPVIATMPADQTVPIGGRLRLSVVASGTSPLTYAWRRDGAALSGASSSIYEIESAEPSHGGSYIVVVSSVAGAVSSAPARVAVVAVAPTVASAPLAQTASAGERVTFTVVANGTPPFTYQWFKDAQEIAGATSAAYSLSTVRAGDGGAYSVRVTNGAGSIMAPSAALNVRSSRLVNLSTRAFVPAGTALTPGFFIRGSGSKPLIIRAVGPTLRLFGVENPVLETRLELIAQGGTSAISSDDRFQAVTDAAAIVGAFPLEPGGKDAAVQASLIPRGYTVRVSPGTATMAGIALAEIYDADVATSASQLVNVSTLGFVGSGENGLTAGFVISGNAPKRLLLRAVGPGLAPFGVMDTLADPQIALVRQGAAEPLVTNDNWPDTTSVRSAFSSAGAFALPVGSNDAAIVVTLEPGAYTVIVSSVTASLTGQALVEIYDLDP